LPRFCVPRRVLDLLGDPFLAELESDLLYLNAADAAFAPSRDRLEIVRRWPLAGSFASMSFSSSRTRRGGTPRILAVSSVVTNRELIRTPMRSLYTHNSYSRSLSPPPILNQGGGPENTSDFASRVHRPEISPPHISYHDKQAEGAPGSVWNLGPAVPRHSLVLIPILQLREESHRIPLGAVGNCGLEIGEKKERCVAPTALESLCFPFPALPGGANLCRAYRADCRRGRLSMKNRGGYGRERQERDCSVCAR
jgi:hypothetical protein